MYNEKRGSNLRLEQDDFDFLLKEKDLEAKRAKRRYNPPAPDFLFAERWDEFVHGRKE